MTSAAPADPGGHGFHRDAAWLTAGSVAQHFLLLLLQVVTARNLSVAEFGILSFFNGMALLYGLLCTAGIAAFLPAAARRRALTGQPPPWGLLAWGAGLSLLFAAANALAAAAGLFGSFRVDLGGLYPWMSVTVASASLMTCVNAVFLGFGKVRWVFHLNLAQEGLRLLVALLLIDAGRADAASLAIGSTLAYLAGTAVAAALYLGWARSFRGAFAGSLRWSAEHGEALAYFIPSSALALLPRLLVFLAGACYSAEAAGLLGAAMVFMTGFGILLQPFQTALISHVQGLRSGDRQAAGRALGLRLAGLIALASAGTWAGGVLLMEPLFGEGLADATVFVPVLVLVFALDAPRAFLDPWLFTFRSKAFLIRVEALKVAGVLALFLAFRGWPLEQALLATAAIGAIANLAKALAARARRNPY